MSWIKNRQGEQESIWGSGWAIREMIERRLGPMRQKPAPLRVGNKVQQLWGLQWWWQMYETKDVRNDDRCKRCKMWWGLLWPKTVRSHNPRGTGALILEEQGETARTRTQRGQLWRGPPTAPVVLKMEAIPPQEIPQEGGRGGPAWPSATPCHSPVSCGALARTTS